MHKRISVIIPVFNRQKSGECSIRSALAQEDCILEVIVVDDASEPPFSLPAELAEDRRVRLLRHEKNAGAPAARNTGICAATHEWIAFLDSDDLFLPGKLYKQMMLANSARPLDVISSGVIYARGEKRSHLTLIPIEANTVARFVSGCWHCPGSTALIHREAFAQVGLFDEKLRRLEDLEWFIRLGLQGGVLRVVTEPLAWIDVNANASIDHVDRAAQRIAQAYIHSSDRLNASDKNRLKAYLALERATARFKKRHFISMWPHLLYSFWIKPRFSKHLVRWWQ